MLTRNELVQFFRAVLSDPDATQMLLVDIYGGQIPMSNLQPANPQPLNYTGDLPGGGSSYDLSENIDEYGTLSVGDVTPETFPDLIDDAPPNSITQTEDGEILAISPEELAMYQQEAHYEELLLDFTDTIEERITFVCNTTSMDAAIAQDMADEIDDAVEVFKAEIASIYDSYNAKGASDTGVIFDVPTHILDVMYIDDEDVTRA